MSYCVVLITAPKGPEARKLAEILLNEKLAACVNIVGDVESFFWWEGKIDTAAEVLLVVKTKKTLLSRLMKAVKRAHSYTVCEIIALPITAGNKAYLDWIDASCGGRKPKQ